MEESDKEVLSNKIKDSSYYKNNNSKRKIKINIKSLIFVISILINISCCLKFLIEHIFLTAKKSNLKIESKKIFLSDFSNFSNVSNLSNNQSNYNHSEYHLNYDHSIYHSNYNHSEYYSDNNHSDHHSNYNLSDNDSKILLLEISNKLHKNIIRVDTVILRLNMRFGNNLIALNNAIYFCEILKCREILVDSSIKFIKKEIFYSRFNMSIKINNNANCYKQGVLCT